MKSPEDGLNRGKCPKIMFKTHQFNMLVCRPVECLLPVATSCLLSETCLCVVPPELAAVM